MARKLLTLQEYIDGFPSMRQAAKAAGIGVGTFSFALSKVEDQSYILVDDDGNVEMLRAVKTKRKGA